MIKLPKLNEQTMFDFETNYHLTMNEERLGKFLAHYESMKIAQNIPGEIVECGVFKGNFSYEICTIEKSLVGKIN